MDYLDVERARDLPGMRLVLTAGVPGPWGEAAKGLFHVKGISYTPVRQVAGEPNEALVAWTGRDNAPQAIWNDEPARSGWTEIVFLAERLAPDPPLVPADPADRALAFGLTHELAGENGFGWSQRLRLLHEGASLPLPDDHPMRRVFERLAAKYGYTPEAAEAAPARALGIVELFARRLAEQRERGSRFLVGDALSLADVYWAAFAALIEPLPEEQCPIPAGLRQQYTTKDAALRAAAEPELLLHRDFVYREYLGLPVDL